MSWRDSKGKWHGVPEYLGGETWAPMPVRRKPRRQTKPRKPVSMATKLAEISRRQMASVKR